MNSAHLHLILTHVPTLGAIFGLCLLLFGLVRRSDELQRASFLVFVAASLSALPTYLTGRPASELFTKSPGLISVDVTDQHAEVAMLALAACLLLGLAALAGLFIFRKAKRIGAWCIALMMALALITSAMLVWTASLGGKLRHTEIQDSSSGLIEH